MNKIPTFFFIFLLIITLCSTKIYAQQKQINKGTVQRIKVHGKSLEGNLEGDSALHFPPQR
jgi:S-formylglutathione hydrolase